MTAAERSSALEVLGVDRGSVGGMMGGSPSGDVGTIATLQVTGAAVAAQPAPAAQSTARDLRDAEPAIRRRLVFAVGMGGGMGPAG